MALTHEDVDILKAYFKADEHEFDYNKNAYIKEMPISERLDAVDPAWSLSEPKIFWRDGEKGTRIVEVTVVLTVKGVHRGGLGQKEIVLTKNGQGEANQAAKSAATDAFKRAARLFGIGRYLLETPNYVKDTGTMQHWLTELTGGQPAPRKQAPAIVPQPQDNRLSEEPQLADGEVGYTDSTTLVSAFIGKNKKRFYIVGGASMFSRDAFKKLGYTESWLDMDIPSGDYNLSDPVTVVYQQDGEYKNVLRIRRDSTNKVEQVREEKVQKSA